MDDKEEEIRQGVFTPVSDVTPPEADPMPNPLGTVLVEEDEEVEILEVIEVIETEGDTVEVTQSLIILHHIKNRTRFKVTAKSGGQAFDGFTARFVFNPSQPIDINTVGYDAGNNTLVFQSPAFDVKGKPDTLTGSSVTLRLHASKNGDANGSLLQVGVTYYLYVLHATGGSDGTFVDLLDEIVAQNASANPCTFTVTAP